jgi:hypothetical protein
LREAKSCSKRLWKGDRQRLLDKILGALDTAGIPCHFQATARMSSFSGRLLGIPLEQPKSTFQYEVRVLRSDVDRAHVAIAGLNITSAPSVWDELNWESITKRLYAAYRNLLNRRD